MTAGGKSQAFVNERQVPVYVLSRLASQLVDIHGQHENQTLLAPGAALTILDHWDPRLQALLEKYQEKFVAYDKAREMVKKWLLKDATRPKTWNGWKGNQGNRRGPDPAGRR